MHRPPLPEAPARDRRVELDRPYDQLEPLPRALWLPVLVNATGRTEARLTDARRWMQALASGQMPSREADFGDAEACAPLRRHVGELALPALAHGVPAIAEQVLRTLLWHFDRIADLQPRRSRADAIAQVADEFREAWRVESAGLEEQLALLREFGDGRQLQWDALRGRLREREWRQAREAAARIGAMPEVVALLERLGRREPQTDPSRQGSPQAPHAARAPRVVVETRIPQAPGELTGVRFDHRLERMHSAEAALLSHPTLRRLWHARRAEGRLLAHDTEAVLVDWRPDPHGLEREAAHRLQPQSLQRGPFVIALDTSGSMRGAPENVAKALVLAALRAAQGQRRGCRLIAFGGSGELQERELCSAEGWASVLDLMGQSFDGGTDVQTPIERAIEIVQQRDWWGADLLIVSDGEFGCVPATLEQLERARATQGLFVQGVLVGDRETLGLMEVCDAIHWMRDWRRHADGDGAHANDRATRSAQPVHSQSLTALYFPNALSPRAARHRPRTAS